MPDMMLMSFVAAVAPRKGNNNKKWPHVFESGIYIY